MVELTLKKKKLTYYDDLKQIPLLKLHRFNIQLMADSGIGSTMEDVSKHLSKMFNYLHEEKYESAKKEVENMYYNFFTMTEVINTSLLSFCILLNDIDGVEVLPTDESELKAHNTLMKAGISVSDILPIIDTVKKKWINS